MEDIIYNDFEKFQREIDIREMKLKKVMSFESDDRIDNILSELKEKKISL